MSISERLRLAEPGMYRPEFKGDAYGLGLAVWAIRDGRDVASSMHKYLKAKAQTGRKAA